MRRNKRPKGPKAHGGCKHRWIEGWGWGLFSKSPYNELGFVWKKDGSPPGFAGLWKGGTSPPPRVGPAAPRRWAAEQPVETPPYLVMRARIFEAAIAAVMSRISEDPLSRTRLRDLRVHIVEQARESGLAFLDGHSTRTEFAKGVRYKEFDSHKVQLRQFIDGNSDDYGSRIPKSIRRWEPNYDEFGGAWITIPLGIDNSIAAQAGFQFENVASAVESRRRKRKKAGRKPIGDHVMSTAERVRKHRAKKRQNVRPSNGRGAASAGSLVPGISAIAAPLIQRERIDEARSTGKIGQGS